MMFINTGTTQSPNWQNVANNNFGQGFTQRGGQITLTAGLYPIEIAYWEGGGGYTMSAQGELGAFGNLPNPTDPSNINGNANSSLPSPLDLQFTLDPSLLGLQNGVQAINAAQVYSNNVSVTNNSGVNVTTSLTATLGDLTINGSTLTVSSSDTTGSPYAYPVVHR